MEQREKERGEERGERERDRKLREEALSLLVVGEMDEILQNFKLVDV